MDLDYLEWRNHHQHHQQPPAKVSAFPLFAPEEPSTKRRTTSSSKFSWRKNIWANIECMLLVFLNWCFLFLTSQRDGEHVQFSSVARTWAASSHLQISNGWSFCAYRAHPSLEKEPCHLISLLPVSSFPAIKWVLFLSSHFLIENMKSFLCF